MLVEINDYLAAGLATMIFMCLLSINPNITGLIDKLLDCYYHPESSAHLHSNEPSTDNIAFKFGRIRIDNESGSEDSENDESNNVQSETTETEETDEKVDNDSYLCDTCAEAQN